MWSSGANISSTYTSTPLHRYHAGNNEAHTHRMYESQYPGEQSAPLEFWGNDFGGSMRAPTLVDYTIVGRETGILWLRSKTGDSSDSIRINFHTDSHAFDRVFAGKKATFVGRLEWDYHGQGHYYQWSLTKIDY